MEGDFLGFSFNGIHSDTLNITRVSDGDRYKDTLPEIEDKTVEIPGMDGAYFYGSNFKIRTFNIPIAFDSMTEVQLRKFKQMFGCQQMGLLIFDEAGTLAVIDSFTDGTTFTVRTYAKSINIEYILSLNY